MFQVKEVFNDFYRLLNGTGGAGLKQMVEKYAGDPLYDILLANIRCIAGMDANEAMKEAYGIYKAFGAQNVDAESLESLYEAACAFDAKWQNLWCSQLITAVVAMLDPDREEAVAACEERTLEAAAAYEEERAAAAFAGKNGKEPETEGGAEEVCAA